MKFSPFQLSVIVGLILSDGYVAYSNKRAKSARLVFDQSLAHSPYFWFVFFILAPYCSSYPSIYKRTLRGNRFFSICFFTRSLPCFTELRSLFYPNGVKIVPYNIYELLTPGALAHWILGDGKSNNGSGLTLCTDSFKVQDVVRLMNVLKIRYNIDCTLHKESKSYRIYIRAQSMPLLRSIVSPYFHLSMDYKLGIQSK